jgi:hypothetical protein
MKTLRESILSQDFDGTDLKKIPIEILVATLVGTGHRGFWLKKYLSKIGAEWAFSKIYNTICGADTCDGCECYVANCSTYEKAALKKLTQMKNPVDSDTVVKILREEVIKPLKECAIIAGRDTKTFLDKTLQVFFDPDSRFDVYDEAECFYFFFNYSKAGWISIDKKASKEDKELIKLIIELN